MDAMRYMVMGLPFDIKDIANEGVSKTKESILDRLKLNETEDSEISGVYGMGNFDL